MEELVIRAKQHIADGNKYYIMWNLTNDPMEMIKNGFLPEMNETGNDEVYGTVYIPQTSANKLMLRMICLGYTNDEIQFLFPESDGLNLREVKRWIYCNMEYYKRKSEKTGESLPFFLWDRSMLYSSDHPKTTMKMFETVGSIRMTHDELNREINVIPVVRYAKDINKGLFYDITGDNHGTFYYCEPESKTYLRYNRLLRFKNKQEAVKYLFPLVNREIDLNNQYFTEHVTKMYQYPEEINDHYEGKFPDAYIASLPHRLHYVGRMFNPFSAEDKYDQEICKIARQLGYDLVIFEQMAGMFETVTEVLDVRDRTTSFDNLIYLTD